MKLKVKHTDASQLMAHLHDYAKVLGKDLGETVREQAGLFCMDLAKITGPSVSSGAGLASTAKKKGMANVQAAVFKMFQPVAFATKNQITAIGKLEVFKMWEKAHGKHEDGKSPMKRWESFQRKYPASGSVVFIENGDYSQMSKLHNRHRKYDGKGGLQDYAKKAKGIFAIVPKERNIEQYMKRKFDDVGIMKSGYWWAAQKIRAKEVRAPAWVKQPEGEAYAIGLPDLNKPMMPTVTIGNTVGRRAMPSGLLKSALSYRMHAMRVKMIQELKKKQIPLWLATAQGQTAASRQSF